MTQAYPRRGHEIRPQTPKEVARERLTKILLEQQHESTSKLKEQKGPHGVLPTWEHNMRSGGFWIPQPAALVAEPSMR